MKKLSLLSLFLLLSLSAFSQVKFGIRTGIGSTLNRIADKNGSDGIAYSKYKNSVAFTFGPQLDFTISDNAAFVTGIWFTTLNTSYTATTLTFFENYVINNSQFVSLPLGFKGYTNEFMTNGKIYFSCLGVADVKVAESLKKTDYALYKEQDYQSMFGASVQLASGLDLLLGESTAVYGGIFFNHDLTNRTSGEHINGDDNLPKYKDALSLKHSQIGLEIGVKF